jgi:hypothetical protein
VMPEMKAFGDVLRETVVRWVAPVDPVFVEREEFGCSCAPGLLEFVGLFVREK